LTSLSEIEKVREALEKYHKNILNRLELGFRQPALYFAILNSSDQSSYELAKLLISGGGDPKHKDQNNQTVLFYACREGKPKCCELLMENGLKPNEEDMYGQTPLFYVAS
jgi:ankyrin repeat protein